MAKKEEVKSKPKANSIDFVPPDGGWGWVVIFGAGFSNLSAYPTMQQFGLLFRDKFTRLGITSSETTTIINMNMAFASCVGLLNGPLFRKFSYRQVSIGGATIMIIGLLMNTFSYNFVTYFVSFSLLYGVGNGVNQSANAVALNTYWKERRRLATGLSWTITGMGPIIWPYFITLLFALYGETGAILILSGFALHSLAGALLLQPVHWHSKSLRNKMVEEEKLIKNTPSNGIRDDKAEIESGYFSQKLKNLSAFSSQYLYNEDDPVNPGYEITDPGIPMLTRANDGYFSQSQSRSKVPSRDGSNRGSRMNSKKPSMTNLLEGRSRKSSTLYLNESKKNSSVNLGVLAQERETKKNSSTNLGALSQERDAKKNTSANLGTLSQDRETREERERERKPKRKNSITLAFNTFIPESEIEDCPTLKAPQDLKAEEKAAVENIDPEKAKSIADRAEKHLAESKSLKSFQMDGQYGEKYNRDNHSNISIKNKDFEKINRKVDGRYEDKYNQDNHSIISIKNKEGDKNTKKIDGLYGEHYNQNNHSNISLKNKEVDNDDRKYLKDNHSNQSTRTRSRRKSNNFNYESEVLKQASMKLEEYLKETEDKEQTNKFRLFINGDALEDEVFEEKPTQEEAEKSLTFCEKVTLFFDFDLLKDLTYVNLMLGLTFASFTELNFSILTPFILGDFGFGKPQIALFMSLLAGVDISVRFCIPFIAGKIGWDNDSFYLFGVLSMAMGRVVLAYSQDYTVVLIVAVIVGFGKGLRTVFMALVIPSHVPLEKLPGASGIQLVTAGIVYLALGPVVGWIKDSVPTVVTLHILNIFTYMTALSWGLEKYFNARKHKKEEKVIFQV